MKRIFPVLFLGVVLFAFNSCQEAAGPESGDPISLSDNFSAPSSGLVIADNERAFISKIRDIVKFQFGWEGTFTVDSVKDYDPGDGIAAVIFLTNSETRESKGVAYAKGTSFFVPRSQLDNFKKSPSAAFIVDGDTGDSEYQLMNVPPTDEMAWTCFDTFCCVPTVIVEGSYPDYEILYGCGCDAYCRMGPPN